MDDGRSLHKKKHSNRSYLPTSAKQAFERKTGSGIQAGPSSSQSSNQQKMGFGFLLDCSPPARGDQSSAKPKKTQKVGTEASYLDNVEIGTASENKMSINNILNASSPTRTRRSEQFRSHETTKSNFLIGQQFFSCSAPQCGARFGSYFEVRMHRSTAHGLESHQCIYCKTVLAREANLMYHVNSKHRRVGENWCYKCSFKSEDYSAYRNHMDMIHSKRKCPKCGQKITRSLYQLHAADCTASSHSRRKRWLRDSAYTMHIWRSISREMETEDGPVSNLVARKKASIASPWNSVVGRYEIVVLVTSFERRSRLNKSLLVGNTQSPVQRCTDCGVRGT